MVEPFQPDGDLAGELPVSKDIFQGLLCYAGHACNYFQKSFEWFQDSPAHIGNRKWFNIKRRKSINATASDTTQKKPTSANQARLSAAFKACFQYLPNVYAESRVNYMR